MLLRESKRPTCSDRRVQSVSINITKLNSIELNHFECYAIATAIAVQREGIRLRRRVSQAISSIMSGTVKMHRGTVMMFTYVNVNTYFATKCTLSHLNNGNVRKISLCFSGFYWKNNIIVSILFSPFSNPNHEHAENVCSSWQILNACPTRNVQIQTNFRPLNDVRKFKLLFVYSEMCEELPSSHCDYRLFTITILKCRFIRWNTEKRKWFDATMFDKRQDWWALNTSFRWWDAINPIWMQCREPINCLWFSCAAAGLLSEKPRTVREPRLARTIHAWYYY